MLTAYKRQYATSKGSASYDYVPRLARNLVGMGLYSRTRVFLSKDTFLYPKELAEQEAGANLLMSEKKSKELPGTGKGSVSPSNTRNTPSCISKVNGATGWGSHLKGSPKISEGLAASGKWAR